VETKQLIAEVAARNGIRIDEEDPAFYIVTLNQLILEETARSLVAEMRNATREFEDAAEKLQVRLGAALAQSQKQLLASLQHDLKNGIRPQRLRLPRPPRWLIAALVSIVVAFMLGLVAAVVFR